MKSSRKPYNPGGTRHFSFFFSDTFNCESANLRIAQRFSDVPRTAPSNSARKYSLTGLYNFLSSPGRDPLTSGLGLEKAGVKVHPITKFVIGINNEQTSVPNIYAIGDVLQVC
jgi:pyruvate/2-oxoglutarate dehydrogenase complex dihydrolipoamide dehydrogenase (E3) component